MNSNFAKHFLYSVSLSQIGFYPDDIKKLPIKNVTSIAQKPFVEIVDKILPSPKVTQTEDARRQVRDYEKQIDRMVYKLYGVTEEEIKTIENKTIKK